MTRFPQLRRVLANLSLVLASIALCYAALEGGLRLSGYPAQEMRFTCFDPLMGNVYCAGARGMIGAGDDARLLSINSDGLADREYPLQPAPGRRRLALLGDSMVAAVDVQPGTGIKHYWERDLATALGAPVDVMNFSVQGTGTWEQLQMYHLRAKKYHPEMVILAFFWGNDVWNNSARAARHGPNPLEDDYRVRGADRFRLAQRQFSGWAWNHSLAYQFLKTGLDRFAELRRQAAILGWGAALSSLGRDVTRSGEPPRTLPIQLGLPEYDWTSADWELTRKLIEKLAAEVKSDGARLVVFQIPAVLHDRSKLPRAQFERFLAERGIAQFGLFDLYDRQPPEAFLAQFRIGDVHWTPEGHRIAAAHTAPSLARLLADRQSP